MLWRTTPSCRSSWCRCWWSTRGFRKHPSGLWSTTSPGISYPAAYGKRNRISHLIYSERQNTHERIVWSRLWFAQAAVLDWTCFLTTSFLTHYTKLVDSHLWSGSRRRQWSVFLPSNFCCCFLIFPHFFLVLAYIYCSLLFSNGQLWYSVLASCLLLSNFFRSPWEWRMSQPPGCYFQQHAYVWVLEKLDENIKTIPFPAGCAVSFFFFIVSFTCISLSPTSLLSAQTGRSEQAWTDQVHATPFYVWEVLPGATHGGKDSFSGHTWGALTVPKRCAAGMLGLQTNIAALV